MQLAEQVLELVSVFKEATRTLYLFFSFPIAIRHWRHYSAEASREVAATSEARGR
jgi:hypothetical protein